MALADRNFYYPTAKQYDHPANYNLAFEDVYFPGADGVTLHGWFFPATDPVGTVLHAHGNAGNITGHFPFVAWLPAVRWNVLCFDYRGYGNSTGRITREGMVNDIHAAAEYLHERPDVKSSKVCLFGQSIGGSTGLVAAAKWDLHLAGIVIDGAFSSYRIEARFVTRRVWYLRGASWLISRYLISDDLSPIDYVPGLPRIPKLFICGDADRIVDYRQTVALHDAATDPKQLWIIPGADHTEAASGELPTGRERIAAFLRLCIA